VLLLCTIGFGISKTVVSSEYRVCFVGFVIGFRLGLNSLYEKEINLLEHSFTHHLGCHLAVLAALRRVFKGMC